MIKEWKEIPGFEGYFASNEGEILSTVRYVYSKKTGDMVPFYRDKILSPRRTKTGYMCVGIGNKKTGGHKLAKVHRLVAMAFVPNPFNFPEVNHIDGNKENNCANNLEWVTHAYNVHHAYITGIQPFSSLRHDLFMKNRKENSVCVVAVSGTGECIHFKSMQECADYIHVDRSCVSRACKNGGKVKGYFVNYDKENHQKEDAE